MKAFMVGASSVISGIAVNKTPYPHIGVGEEGRGRKYVRIALGKQDFDEKTESVTNASVIKTKEKGTLLIVKPRNNEDKRALVLVDIAAGFRGCTNWSGVTTVKTPCKKRGLVVFESQCSDCGTAIEPGMPHPDQGMAYNWPTFPTAGITVLAEGDRAQGTAGRMGGHVVRLLIMEPGATFRVSRGGRLYGAPSKRYVRWTGEKLELGTFDELFPPTEDEVAEGEVL